jgi:signal transduction histidine kinase
VIAHGDGAGGIRVLVSNRAPHDTEVERGRGLTGMAERVAAAGGELETELRGDDFVVEARLPAVPRPGADVQEATQ